MNTHTSWSCTPPCRCAQMYSKAQRGLARWRGVGNVAEATLRCLCLHAANGWFVFCFAFGVKSKPKLKKRQKSEKKSLLTLVFCACAKEFQPWEKRYQESLKEEWWRHNFWFPSIRKQLMETPVWSHGAAKETVLQTDISGKAWIITVWKGLSASDSQSVWEHCGWFKRLLSGKSVAISKQSMNLQSSCFSFLLQMFWSNKACTTKHTLEPEESELWCLPPYLNSVYEVLLDY